MRVQRVTEQVEATGDAPRGRHAVSPPPLGRR
jgi:hypothetical protein